MKKSMIAVLTGCALVGTVRAEVLEMPSIPTANRKSSMEVMPSVAVMVVVL